MLIQILIILLCILGSAFYAGIETGMISINRMRLRHFVKEGSRRAELIQGLLEKPDRLLGTTLLGTNLCHVMASVVTASLAIKISETWGPAISSVLITVLLLIFGEYLPKAWFQAMPYRRCRVFAKPLYVSWMIMSPVVAVISGVTKLLLPRADSKDHDASLFVTRDELQHLAHEVETGGMLSSRERVMIHQVMELSRHVAREIMTPRSDFTSVTEETTVAEACDQARDSDVTRVPVTDAEGKKFVGVVNIYDLLSTQDTDSPLRVRDFMRSPQFVSEDMPVDDILPRLRLSRQPLCLVRNEQAEVTGMVTTEDILEVIVGEL